MKPIKRKKRTDPQSVFPAATKGAAVYVVISDQAGSVAVGSKQKCLVFVNRALDEQAEIESLGNPASYRLKKVTSL